MFINYSNHPSASWAEEQSAAAKSYGKIYDVAFPEVSVATSEKEIEKLAEEQLERLQKITEENGCNLNQTVIMCQGEFSLTYAVITRLKKNYPGCKVVCAISRREVVEEQKDGCNVKTVRFRFCGFREYI